MTSLHDFADPSGEASAQVALANERRRVTERRERERQAYIAKQERIARPAPVVRDNALPEASAQQVRIAKELLQSRSPEAVAQRARERAERERELRDEAIASAIAEAQRPKDPRTSAEKLAGQPFHDPEHGKGRIVTEVPSPHEPAPVTHIAGIAISADVIV